MRSKPLIILALVLLALVLLKVAQDVSHRSQLSETGLEDLLTDLSVTQIGRLVITGPAGDELVLASQGSEWVVESSFGHPADAGKVEQITEALAGLQGEFRSEESSVLADYGLDETQAIHLEIFDLGGTERGHLLLGKRLTGGSGFFLRLEGEEKAFAVQGNLLGNLGIWGEKRDPEGKRFLDLKVVQVDRESVDRVLLTHGGERLELIKAFAEPAADSLPVDRSQFTWRLDGDEAKKSAADGVLGALASIRARDLLDPAGDYAFAEKVQRAEITLADGSRKSVEFGVALTEPEAGVAMRLGGSDFVYLVYDNLPERIFKSREDFTPEED